MQLPNGDGTDGVGYGVDYPIFWIDKFHPHGANQHTAFAAKSRVEVDAFHAAARWAESITVRLGCVILPKAICRAITPPSCSIPMATISRRSSEAVEIQAVNAQELQFFDKAKRTTV